MTPLGTFRLGWCAGIIATMIISAGIGIKSALLLACGLAVGLLGLFAMAIPACAFCKEPVFMSYWGGGRRWPPADLRCHRCSRLASDTRGPND